VVESKIHKDFDQGIVTVTFQQVEHPAMPPQDGIVRIPLLEGTMTYSHVDAGHTAAAYEVTIDIDSSLPDWVVALATRAVPIYTLLAVTEQADRTQGQYEDFVKEQQEQIRF
ncbi:MAG: hypothetical protein QGG40_02345, partial [Myxococcota bacterium]|nr:hypothetical protein [Myxococcota bacterium]